MSEYQCYEFVALDRSLTSKEMTELRAISTRAKITPTRFWNEYQRGDLKADPLKLVARYFDAHLYFANWGSRRLMLRVCANHVDAREVRPYFVGDAARVTKAANYVVLDLRSDLEGPDDDEPYRGMLDALVPVRSELMSGDLRCAYLAWLLAVQAEEVDDDDVEPPVPQGLRALTAAQATLVEFLRIDEDLLAAAAAASAPPTDDARAMRAWVTALPSHIKDSLLLRSIEEPDLALGIELSRMYRSETKASSTMAKRFVRDLRADAERVRARREERERLAREKAKKAAHGAKNRRLDTLAERRDAAWRDLEAMIDKKEYDAAMKLARDLYDLAERDESAAAFTKLFEEIRKRHVRRRGFFDRWKRENSIARWSGA